MEYIGWSLAGILMIITITSLDHASWNVDWVHWNKAQEICADKGSVREVTYASEREYKGRTMYRTVEGKCLNGDQFDYKWESNI